MDKPELSKQKKPIVFIVDDVPKNLQVLGNTLRNRDYNISVATSGEQALSMMDKILPDLILLDVVMPGIDGFQVCKKLKTSEKTKDIPIIFLTAKTQTEDIVKGFELGAVDYVTKPFNKEELLAMAHKKGIPATSDAGKETLINALEGREEEPVEVPKEVPKEKPVEVPKEVPKVAEEVKKEVKKEEPKKSKNKPGK